MAREQRRLAAIVAADVVGYSLLMGRDESGTLARLRAHRTDIIDPAIAAHGGRIVKTMGDGLLLEFSSAVDATRCAIEVQTAMAERNTDVPEGERIVFRIGVNLGDIIIDGDDIHGDGVNVAARLEAAAPPGGIVLAGAVYDAVSGRVKTRFDDLGTLHLKNIERPVRAYRVRVEGAAVSPGLTLPPGAAAPLALPDKPSIAVLPFQNMSGDPDQEYFADGMVDDIITGLSRTRQIFVIARNSSFTYKGRAVDIKQIGRELGVRYVLEGSVRRAANRMRISGQLVDAQTGAHIWADRFEGDVADIFDLQDQVTAKVVASILPNVERAEIERTSRKPTANLEAYDYFLRGRQCVSRFTPEGHTEALDFFNKAIALAPTFALAFARAAACYADRKAWGWPVSPDDAREAERLARAALELDRTDPMVLSAAGWAIAFVAERIDEGHALVQLSVERDPNHFLGWNVLGWTSLFQGDPGALEHFERAIRLNPLHPLLFGVQNGVAASYHLRNDYQNALEWSSKVLLVQPKLLFALCLRASSLAHLGQLTEARRTVDIIRTVQPPVFLTNLSRFFTVVREDILDNLREGLRVAGLPEGESASLVLPDKPSIAVLPFENMSGDSEQEYFCDGLVEDIITALSRFKSLFVIAGNSSFTYKGKVVDIKQIGRELGVRYVLEGSVRKAGGRLRITAQLSETTAGVHIWADKIDASLEDVFDVQDRLTARVVGSIAPKIERAEIDRAKRKPPDRLDSYDLFLKGMALSHRRATLNEAYRLFKDALKQDPEYAAAYAMASFVSLLVQAFNGVPIAPERRTEAIRFAELAAKYGSDDAFVLARSAHVVAYLGREYDRASSQVDHAIALNPNLALAWYSGGWVSLLGMRPDRAMECFDRMVRLSPLDPLRTNIWYGTAWAHFFRERYDLGCEAATKAIEAGADVHALGAFVANAVLAGRDAEARNVAAQLLRLQPQFRVIHVRDAFPFRSGQVCDKIEKAFRDAGISL